MENRKGKHVESCMTETTPVEVDIYKCENILRLKVTYRVLTEAVDLSMVVVILNVREIIVNI